MNDFTLFHEVIRCRHTDVTAYFYPEFLWKQETAIFSENIGQSIAFIEAECSDEEFYWLSEVFADIAQQTQSAAFVACLRRRLKLVEDPEWQEDILRGIEAAQGRLQGV